MKKGLKILGIAIIALVIIAGIGMKVSGIYPIGLGFHDNIIQNDGLAVEGYDAVAYFNQNEAIKGTSNYTTNWDGVTWNFSSNENLEHFKSNPEQYAPAYGGHCSFAVGKGFAVHGNPEIWSINNDNLLFYSNEEVKTEGLADVDALITNADKNWN